MATKYTYSKSIDFGGNLAEKQLEDEIEADPGIAPTCDYVNRSEDVVDIWFSAALSGPEQTTLNGLVSAHVPYTPAGLEIMSTGTNNTTTQLISTQTANRSMYLPDENDTLVGVDCVQTLTNKTIATANNTITVAASDVASGTFVDARIAASNVTQHVASINHDLLLNYVAAEHIDWTSDAGASNIHDNNILASSITQHQASIDHNSLTNLASGDVHTQYALLAGRAGGQTLIGGTAASNNLTLESTSNATKGEIHLLDTTGIGNTDPSGFFDVRKVAAGATNHVRFTLYDTTGVDTYNLNIDTADNSGVIMSCEDGSKRQATVFAADASGGSKTIFGVASSSDSGTSWDPCFTVTQNCNVGVGKHTPAEALDIVGNIALSGTVDGRDIATDGATLDMLRCKMSVVVATTAHTNTLGTGYSYSATGGSSGRGQMTWTSGPTTIDGVTLTNDDRILVQQNFLAETTDITCVADVSGSLDGTYFILYDSAGSVAFWIDVDNSGTLEPSHGAARSVEITTISTNDSAANVAIEVRKAINDDSEFHAMSSGAVVSVRDKYKGERTDASAGTSGFTMNVTQQGTKGDENGIYVRTAQSTWDRADDFDADGKVKAGTRTYVQKGTKWAGSYWTLLTADPITIGGASGSAIDFAHTMSINSAGDVGINTNPSGEYKLKINGDYGQNGFCIQSGESLGDIAMHISDRDDTFQILEMEADQGYITMGKTYAQTLLDNGTVYGLDNQHSGVAVDFNTQNGTYRIAGVDIVMPTGGTAGQVLTKVDGTSYNTQWATPSSLPICSDVHASSLITTTSSTHVLASGMTITPASGTYAVTFAASISSSSNSGIVFTQIYAGGVAQGVEMRFLRGDSSTDNDAGLTCVAKVTVNGSQAIEGRWRRGSGTAEMRGRSLMIVQVSA